MSLSREATKEICDYIKENSSTLFGQKFRECRFITSVQVQLKSDKFETKFLIISKFRVFLLSGKQIGHLKVEKCFNVLALKQLQVLTPEYALSVSWEERGRVSTCAIKTNNEKEATDLACEFLSSLKHYFPDIKDSLNKFLKLSPPLLKLFSHLPSSTPDLPCNNFRRSYVTYCDFIDQLYREDVVWEIEHVYFVNNIREIRLDDFSHLPIKDQVAIICCAQFSSYFNGIFLDSYKLCAEIVEAVLTVVRRSHSLKSLNLVNCGLPRDFFVQLAAVLQHNSTVPLEYLDLSSNYIDDKKGIAQLAIVLPRLPNLKSLILNDCGLSEKSIHNLAVGLYTGFSIDNSSISGKFELRNLSLTKNVLKDDTNELINFISLCNTLRTLDLSHTGFNIDKLWPALKLGGLQLECLCLAGCQSGKKNKENLQLTVKELFSSMVNLKQLDLSKVSVSVEVLQSILQGISNNNRILDISLNLDGALEGRAFTPVFVQFIAACPISQLSLRDNILERDLAKILPVLSKMHSLKSLDLGGMNFHGLRSNKKYSNTLSKVLTELGDLISNQELNLEELVLSDCRLGCAYLSVVLDSLGATTKLKYLDISNNEIGNVGARLLSKTLQLNNSLERLNIDRNQIGIEGFIEISHGLKLNRCLTSLIYPINDVASIPDRTKVISVMAGIEKCLERNKTNLHLSAQCCQATLHTLINNCEKYNINETDENKIIFHNLIRSIVELWNCSPLNVPLDNTLEEILNLIDKIRNENSEFFAQKFFEVLSSKSVEICSETEERNSHFNKIYDRDMLRERIRLAIEAYLTQTSWNLIHNKADTLLSSNNALKIRGALSNCNIDNSVHVVISERFPGSLMRRPNSVFHESLVASLTSGENSFEGLLLNDEPNGIDKSVPLVHLAKNRPKPARHLRNRLNSSLKQSSGSIATDDSFDYFNDSKPLQKSRQSSGAENNNHQNHANISIESIEEPRSSPLNSSTTTPPPLIPRRNRVFGVPPKLPPKPSPESPTTASILSDLRNGHNSKMHADAE